MNYSTLKKTVVLSFVSLIVVGMASAQTDTSKSMKKMTMSDSSATPKLFGGARQYSTWSIGANVGVTGEHMVTGGVDHFHNSQIDLGYGVSLRDQLSHAFSLELNYNGGNVKGKNDNPGPNAKGDGLSSPYGFQSFNTNFNNATLSGVVNIGTVSFLHRKNNVIFYASAGAGFSFYTPSFVNVFYPNSSLGGYINQAGDGSNDGYKYTHAVTEWIIPVGTGVKFKLTDALDLNFGYTENFLDGFNFTGDKHGYPSTRDHYAYGYGGLEYTFGTKSKPSLEWANPIALMYDELYDAALRQEVEALKARVANVETAVADLKKDSDGDGVSDQFDKCPNTPAGTVVDGSGCPIIFPKPVDTASHAAPVQPYGNIQFEFDSSVLKTSSYPILDATAADMKANGNTVTVAGYASSEGTAAHNLRLSRDRANSVKTYLVNGGVDAKHLKIKAYGETHPIADNSTEAGRILNRRVEFHK